MFSSSMTTVFQKYRRYLPPQPGVTFYMTPQANRRTQTEGEKGHKKVENAINMEPLDTETIVRYYKYTHM